MEGTDIAAGLPVAVVFGISVLVTLVTSFLKDVTWGARTKNLLATGLSIVAAAIATWTTGDLEARPLFELTVYVYGLAQGFYNLILKGTIINDKLTYSGVTPNIEADSHAGGETEDVPDEDLSVSHYGEHDQNHEH